MYNGALEYQGNRCPNGGACGEEDKQTAVDGLDLRNIDLTTSLTPKTSNVKIKQYVGKTVLTGIGSGAAWGSRRVRFKASNVSIYFKDDVIEANQCPPDRVPIGKPKVAKTSQMGLFICAKLDPRITLGPVNNYPAPTNWDYSVDADCPTGAIVMGAIYPGKIGDPWQIQCSDLKVKQ